MGHPELVPGSRNANKIQDFHLTKLDYRLVKVTPGCIRYYLISPGFRKMTKFVPGAMVK